MKNGVLFLVFIVAAFSMVAEARKPAVEDFVGVETNSYLQTPPGTEVQFDFGNHIEPQTSQLSKQSSQWFSLGFLGLFVSLPFLMWFAITRSVETQTTETTEVASTANVKQLDDYRATENEEEITEEEKKAS
ncbi:MAG: hypothetical protein CME62_07655 [Halobacteriovoraceae bacterium]|nr:hypothetical protein [Halobacteriovoraceae bacterium]